MPSRRWSRCSSARSPPCCIVLTRWQAVHLLPADWFYRILGVHGMSMLIFFIIFFEMAVLYFASTVLLNAAQLRPEDLVGRLRADGGRRADGRGDDVGRAGPTCCSRRTCRFAPTRSSTSASSSSRSGTLVGVAIFFANLVVAKRERTYEGSLPLVVYGAMTAAIIAVITLLHGAAIYIPTFLWSLGLMNVDPEVYRLVWWGLGHSSQQINVAAMVAIWYMLGALTIGAVVAQREDQPVGVRALHPLHLDGVGAPPAGRSRAWARRGRS